MQKIFDLLLAIGYFPIKNWREIIFTIIFIALFFTIDFIIWNKTKKSFWHKIIKDFK